MRKGILTIFMVVAAFLIGRCTVPRMNVELNGTSDLFKTVNHVDLSDVDYLQKVYSDADNDIAYYMYTGDRDAIHVGDFVYAPYGEKFKVVSIDCIGFAIEPCDDATYVQTGFSGMGILTKDKDQVGAISYIQGSDIYCIWT